MFMSSQKVVEKTKAGIFQIGSIDSQDHFQNNGTGFIVHKNGLMITCNHVVENLHNIAVITENFLKTKRVPLGVKIEMQNAQIDLATLKLTGFGFQHMGLKPLEMGRPEKTKVGDEVFFWGYPLDAFTQTFHKGMISAILLSQNNRKLFQIDASINKGNSGGPLLDSEGKVIGVINRRMGSIGERLKQIIKNKNKTHSYFTGAEIDIIDTFDEIIKKLDSTINVGIGYAISIDSIADL